ncbi:amino acid adenylation domain-containing protein [Alteromonas sp. 76-1]|uniref:non-ribosomal peptide synthetase/type I polyketide synthase n=1 Tax=Alteromonas sp. 76-1 TaxID=2358187 RepID=UPI000FD17261|nr:non-ribosomal peptide synthetase/type I polyketide synthase [Alteromonas sp. 76-1]VEL98330.1 amino acid adenylation domain-containing protein [Alteromonas sp. 76-1]
MSMQSLVQEAIDEGVILYLEDGKLKFEATRAKLSESLKNKLKENKQEIIAYLQKLEHRKQVSQLPPLEKRKDTDAPAPMSYAQRRLWFIDQLGEGSSQYNMSAAYRLTGRLNKTALVEAFSTILDRHQILRSSFVEQNDQIWVLDREKVELPFQEVDLSTVDESQQKKRIEQLLASDIANPFNLKTDVLMRIHLITLSETEFVVMLNMHHIVSDGWSMGVLISEFGTIYNSLCESKPITLTPLPLQYSDYAQWQSSWFKSESMSSQLSFWHQYLAELPPVHSLPLDRPRATQQDFTGKIFFQEFDSKLTEHIKLFCKKHDVTMFMFMQTVYAIVLSYFSDELDIVMGTPVAGRPDTKLESLIGVFANTLVLRTQIVRKHSFLSLLKQNKKDIVEAFNHQEIPFELLVEKLKPKRSLSYSPVFQVLFTLDNQSQNDIRLSDLSLAPIFSDSPATKFDLELYIGEVDSRLLVNWTYSTALFERATIANFAKTFRQIIDGVLCNCECPLEHLKLVSDKELNTLKSRNNRVSETGTKPDLMSMCPYQLFEQQVDNQPRDIAISCGEQSITFAKLNASANQLARYLIAQGVQNQDVVGLCLGRSIDLVVALLAIHKAGAAYLPLDPAYPSERLDYMLLDAQSKLVITERKISNHVFTIDTLFIDERERYAEFSQKNLTEKEVKICSDYLSHIIYTSGSTGKPKGVCIEHKSVAALVNWCQNTFTQEETKSVLFSTSICFDLSVFEIWSALASGGKVLLVENILALVDNSKLEPTLINTVPSALISVLDNNAIPKSVVTINVAGEPLTRALVNRTITQTSAKRVNNLYGPSEDTTYSTHAEFTATIEIEPTIGRAISDTELYVMASSNQLAPLGAVGELYIGGKGLARGYWNNASITQEKFVPNPFGREGRVYKTGDLVRWDELGQLVFIGRVDHQVKINGFRIELGEIISAINSLQEVKESVVVVDDSIAREKRLIAYVVAKNSDIDADQSSNEIIASSIRSKLAETLPSFMIPAVFILLPKMPLTQSGKIDRQALPLPDKSVINQNDHVEPASEKELVLCQIWEELLNVSPIGIQDNFFELGGHSLLATRLIGKIKAQLSIDVPLKLIFQNPTIEAFALAIEKNAQSISLPIIESLGNDGVYPMSYAQQRLWIIDKLESGSPQYNIVNCFELNGQLELNALQVALRKVMSRHKGLRTKFKEVSGQYQAVISDDEQLPLQIISEETFSSASVELSENNIVLENKQIPQFVDDLITKEINHVFDLEHDLLIRISLVQAAKQRHFLVFNIHHIISDGWSLGVLVNEISEFYNQYVGNTHAALIELPVQYSDFAMWQKNVLTGTFYEQHIEYWRDKLADIPSVHGLALDYERPKKQSYRGDFVKQTISQNLMEKVEQLSLSYQITPFVFLQTTLSLLLNRYSGEQDIVIGTPISGRLQESLNSVIGFFVNTLPLRTHVLPDETFGQLLTKNGKGFIEAYDHQSIPFEMLVDKLNPVRSLSHSPIFQIMFTLQNNQNEAFSLTGLEIKTVNRNGQYVKCDLDIVAQDTEQGLSIFWGYNKDLFETDSIERLSKSFVSLLTQVVESPELNTGEYEVITEEDKFTLTSELNSTETQFDDSVCFHQLFQSAVDLYPKNNALIFNNEVMTYAELNQRSNRLARYLLKQGVKTNDCIGLICQRSFEMVIGIYAIWKAGAAYMPIEPDFPVERQQYMLDNAEVKLVLSQQECHTQLSKLSCRHLILDDIELNKQLALIDEGNLIENEVFYHSTNLAYVIYTSGSTGKPKGVMVQHQALVNRIHWMQGEYQLNQSDVVLQKTPFSFDVSVWEFCWPLQEGATLVIAKPLGHKDPKYLRKTIEQYDVTTLHFVPSLLSQILKAEQWYDLKNVKHVFCSGEALSTSLVEAFYANDTVLKAKTKLHNLYGPTEAAIDVSFWECSPSNGCRQIPIGRPINNIQLYVLDKNRKIVPPGCVGELYIGGVGLAKGYINDVYLTRERFIEIDPGIGLVSRLYRTGDLARWNNRGYLEYSGRIDFQVKVNGVRIELGEIESQICAIPLIADCVVIAQQTDNAGSNLVAFIVDSNSSKSTGQLPEFDEEVNTKGLDRVAEIKSILKTTLPDFMVPAHFVFLPELPLSSNGKIDRKQLPKNTRKILKVSDVQVPNGELEQKLVSLWSNLIGIDSLGVHDNFFDIGGNSLLSIQLQRQLEEIHNIEIDVTDIFEYPTINELATFIRTGSKNQPDSKRKPRARVGGDNKNIDIAIIASSVRFPDANTVNAFWQNIKSGKESLQHFSEEELKDAGVSEVLINHPDYVKSGFVLDGLKSFDAKFFGFTPREAEVLDPQQRLLFETTYEILEQAGYGNQSIARNVGVFVGSGDSNYLLNNLLSNTELMNDFGMAVLHANSKDYTATRLSYRLNLVGPAINTSTACSTSLVSLHQACQSLLLDECEMAVAGGAGIAQLEPSGYLYQDGGIGSKDGHCRAFDKDSSGTRGGSGVGVVLLKRLDDAIDDGDTIHAVIKGSAVNNDGSGKVGYTAPSVFGQASVIRDALDVASVDAASIQYIETHGTGTKLGDPIEIKALNKVFGANASGSCAITSLKPNIGHLDAAAGVAGLIKTVEALKHQQLPPSINFKQANPEIDFENSPFYVNTELKAWPRDGETPRRAGVSSFGIGGTNAHVVLEEAPLLRHEESVDDKAQLLILSAKTETALTQMQENLSRHLSANTHQALSDVSFTLQVGRSDYEYRGYAVCHSQTGAIEQLSQPQGLKRGVCESGHQPAQVWMFSGQGTQYIGMSAGLYEQEPVFKQQLDECADLLKAHIGMPQIESDIRVALFAAESEASSALLAQTRLTQPILFAVEYSLAKLLLSWGLRPEVMIGHSLGEYVAACLAGVMSLPDALKLVSARGRLMQAMAPGSMLSVGLDEAGLATYLEGTDLSIAALNGRKSSVVSGPSASIEALEITLSADDVMSKRLPTSHAFHSSMMEGMLGDFEAELSSVELRAPEQRYVSNVTGKLAGKEVTAASYWLKHVREAVRFSEGIEYIHQEEGLSAGAVWLEVGPGMVLGSLVRQHGLAGNHTLVHSMRHSQQALADREVLLGMLGECWLRGVTIDWQQVRGKVRRVPLPTYPFERERYWIDINKNNIYGQQVSHQKQGEVADWFYVPSWQLKSNVCSERGGSNAHCNLIFADERGVGDAIATLLNEANQTVLIVRAGEQFSDSGNAEFEIKANQPTDYKKLFDRIEESGLRVTRIIHCWSANVSEPCISDENQYLESPVSLPIGSASLLYSIQNMGNLINQESFEVNVIGNAFNRVTGEESICAKNAMISGISTVLQQEYPNVSSYIIDIDDACELEAKQLWAKRVVHELGANTRERKIAYRGKNRWVQCFNKLQSSSKVSEGDQASYIKPKGTYFITGGLGKIGLALARFIAQASEVNLVLLSRSSFPSKSLWNQILSDQNTSGIDSVVKEKIKNLLEIESLGSTVTVYQGNVACLESMTQIFDAVENQFGNINGVVHAAADLSNFVRPLQELEEQDYQRQFETKIKGVLVLEQLFKKTKPEFCLLMSSLSSVLGGLGFSAYATANTFMDAFVNKKHNEEDYFWLSVNWDGWVEQSSPGIGLIDPYSMTFEQGVKAFNHVMSVRNTAQIINSTGSLYERLKQCVENSDISETRQLYTRPELNETFVAPETDIEKRIVAIWQVLLGIEQIGINDNFFSLGGDSLIATRLISHIRTEFSQEGIEFSLRDFFADPVIKSIAESISKRILSQQVKIKKELLIQSETREEGII